MLYTSEDDEGNGYNRVCHSPELRCLSPHDYRPDSLLSLKEDDETLEEYLDGEDLPNLRTVILL